MQPGAGVGPFLAGLVDGDCQRSGDLHVPQTGKVSEFDHPGRGRVFDSQPSQGVVKGQEPLIGFWSQGVNQFQALPSATVPEPPFLSRPFNQNSSHCLSCRAKKMSPTVPVFGPAGVHQTKPGIVNQVRSLQGLPRLFLSQFCRSQFPQLVIHEREQLRSGPGVSLFDRGEDLRNFRHGPGSWK